MPAGNLLRQALQARSLSLMVLVVAGLVLIGGAKPVHIGSLQQAG